MVWILYNYVMFNISSREKDDLDMSKKESNPPDAQTVSNVLSLAM